MVDKFSKIRPPIDIIRKNFANSFAGRGCITIGAHDVKHVFLDFGKEDDYNAVAANSFVNVCRDFVMRLEKWTTNFKPEPNTTRAPV